MVHIAWMLDGEKKARGGGLDAAFRRMKKDQSLSTPAGSPGASSPPPTAGSPPRGRSMSVVAGNEAEPNVKEKKKGKKGKEKAKDQDRDGEEEDGNVGGEITKISSHYFRRGF